MKCKICNKQAKIKGLCPSCYKLEYYYKKKDKINRDRRIKYNNKKLKNKYVKKEIGKNGFIKEDKGRLEKIFIIPPLSILNPMTKRWIDRKKYWLKMGIQSELGRGKNLLHSSDLMKRMGSKSTSIFDPVLCEIMYNWFSKEEDYILDPFAGGSVRGIVASKRKRNYIGVELLKNQVKHNRLQGENICNLNKPKWIIDDAINIKRLDRKFNMIFTCPPYFNLEKYSNDKRDLSNMNLEDFLYKYDKIIKESVSLLEDNSFAVFVVGEVRFKNEFIGLVGETINSFESTGMSYYNELILMQSQASAAMIAERVMNNSRKIPRCHQHVLIFVKGNPKIAANRMGLI